jgi:hypothetical protein
MTPHRFTELAQAYGGDLQRWPGAERDAAQALLASGDSTLNAVLREASWLDGQLDSHQLPAVSPQLVRQIVADAREEQSFWARSFSWLFGASFVGVGVAGIAAGILMASLTLPLAVEHEALPNVFDSGDGDVVFNLDAAEETPQ